MLTLVFDDHPRSSTDQPARVATEWRDEHGRAFAVGTVGPHARQIAWTGLGTFRFTVDSRDVHFHPDPGVDRAWAADAFTRLIQPLILQAQGLPALHGSAVADADGAIVFCGLSGHGKSTLAYALAGRPGFSQLADDAVVLRPDGPTAFVVTPLPFRPRLRPPSAAVLQPPGHDTAGGRPSTFHESPLRAVVVLSQLSSDEGSADAPRMTPVAPATAFRLLLTHAHCFDEADRDAMRAMVQHYFALAETVPVITLAYRPDFAALPRLVDTLLAALDGAPQDRSGPTTR